MPGYATRLVSVAIGGHDYTVRALSDTQQFADPHGLAERAGISSALWSLFGQVWPSGRVLAQAMSLIEIAGRRILEVGCGLGLSSLVLKRRGADIVASDHHPLAELFLQRNAALNGLKTIDYRDLPWEVPTPLLGQFDLIIGSDILYERGHSELLGALVERHALAHCEVIITDPGRGNSGAFSTAMRGQGYEMQERRSAFNDSDLPPFRGRLLSFQR